MPVLPRPLSPVRRLLEECFILSFAPRSPLHTLTGQEGRGLQGDREARTVTVEQGARLARCGCWGTGWERGSMPESEPLMPLKLSERSRYGLVCGRFPG